MAFTLDQLTSLDDAISQGVLKVKYADKEVEYQSLENMMIVRNLMRRELGLAGNPSGRTFASFNKGLHPPINTADGPPYIEDGDDLEFFDDDFDDDLSTPDF